MTAKYYERGKNCNKIHIWHHAESNKQLTRHINIFLKDNQSVNYTIKYCNYDICSYIKSIG